MAKNAPKAGKKKKDYSFKFLNRFMIIQLLLILALSVFITNAICSRAKVNAKEHLSALGNERAFVIEDFVSNAEATLNAFSKAPQILDVLENPNDAKAVKAAQDYNSAFAEGLTGLEGLYICDWDSKTLTHSTLATVGKVIRSGQSLSDLQLSIQSAGNEVYTLGVLVSPSSGNTVLSMYKGISDSEGHLKGFVGYAIETKALVNKLNEMKTPGVTTSFYAMLDVPSKTYVFDQESDEAAGTPIAQEDLLRTCDEVKGKNEAVTDTYEYKAGPMTVLGTYEYMPKRQWILLMNADKKEVYNLVNAMIMFMVVFIILQAAAMTMFSYLNRKQERVNERLLSSIDKIKETKHSLSSAMYNDVLTAVGNRVRFAMDMDNVTDSQNNPYYFAMFNIIDFSGINTQFGNDTGDTLLIRTADILKEKFDASSIYRTGSDEFVVVVKTESGNPRQEVVLDNVNEALRKLVLPEAVEGIGTLYPKYRVAVIKKNNEIDPTVITVMKEMTKMKGEAVLGMIDYSDLTEMGI
jgi:diguanylate cyclase (GGDEF)-like protein